MALDTGYSNSGNVPESHAMRPQVDRDIERLSIDSPRSMLVQLLAVGSNSIDVA